MARADHIFVNRFNGVYNHHGIDCGDGTVIHYTSKTWREARRVDRTPMEDFCGEDKVQVRDYDDFREILEQTEDQEMDKLVRTASRKINKLLDSLRGLQAVSLDFSDDAVISRAESRLGESSFGLVSNNCEHFAAWCKTGISSSPQIDSIWQASISGPRFMRRRAQHLMTEVFENPWLKSSN